MTTPINDTLNPINPFDEPRIIEDPQEFFEKHQTKIVGGVLILIAIFLAALGWWLWKLQVEDKAMRRFHEARSAEEFQALAQEYPNTSAGGFAQLQAARDHQAHARWAEAAAAHQEFLKYHRKSPLAGVAELGHARCLEALNDTDAALSAYQKIINTSPPHSMVAVAHLGAARCLLAMKNEEAARHLLSEFIATTKSSAFLPEAEEMLRNLSTHPIR